MTVKEILGQIQKELDQKLHMFSVTVDRLDDKITNIKNEIDKSEINHIKDYEHFKREFELELRNIKDNLTSMREIISEKISRLEKEEDKAKDKEMSVIAKIAVWVAVVFGLIAFFDIHLSDVLEFIKGFLK